MVSKLINYCNQKNIKFLSTGFDEESIDLLDRLDIELFKIASGEITNKKLLKHIASKNKDIILSTGMAEFKEIHEAIQTLILGGIKRTNNCSSLLFTISNSFM